LKLSAAIFLSISLLVSTTIPTRDVLGEDISSMTTKDTKLDLVVHQILDLKKIALFSKDYKKAQSNENKIPEFHVSSQTNISRYSSTAGIDIGALTALAFNKAILDTSIRYLNLRTQSPQLSADQGEKAARDKNELLPKQAAISQYSAGSGIYLAALASVAADKAIINTMITQLDSSGISLSIAKNPIKPKDEQIVTIRYYDMITKRGIPEASVDGWITNSSGLTTAFFSGVTNRSGTLLHSWNVNSDSQPGNLTVVAEGFHRGYQKASKTAEFVVKNPSSP